MFPPLRGSSRPTFHRRSHASLCCAPGGFKTAPRRLNGIASTGTIPSPPAAKDDEKETPMANAL
ncbi:MAG: hypothetical protein AAFQ21_14760, partial [Pseudomonadota bacterium]